MPRFLLSIAVLLSLAAIAGCGGGSSTDGSTEADAEPFRIPIPGGTPDYRYEKELKVESSGLAGEEPKPAIPKSAPPEFLAASDLIEGIGQMANPGGEVTVQYAAFDYEGNKLSSSWEEGKPTTFTLGKGEVIDGWEEGIVGMEIGDQRELVVPPNSTGGPFPKGLPEDETLIFVIETLPKKSAGKQQQQPKPAKKVTSTKKKSKPEVEVPSGPPPKKLEIKDLEEGSGPAAKPGDEVTVHYVGVNYRTGKQFDASWDRGEPFTFKLGEGLVIEGWEKGIPGMKPGGRRELIIPPELGYGYGRTEGIPPGSTLIFVVDLISVG
jgi:peptidylprolyl isomerase